MVSIVVLISTNTRNPMYLRVWTEFYPYNIQKVCVGFVTTTDANVINSSFSVIHVNDMRKLFAQKLSIKNCDMSLYFIFQYNISFFKYIFNFGFDKWVLQGNNKALFI